MLIFLLAWAMPGAVLAAAERQARPSVLFIAIDDLNDWVGCMGGHPHVRTPHIDRLAARGTAFLNAHCQAPLCNPSRTSLLTGRRPTTTGVYALEPWFRTAEALRDVVTLPQHFAAAGYRTIHAGKIWHAGHPPPPERPAEFQRWARVEPGLRPAQPFVPETPGGHPAMDWGPFPAEDSQHQDYRIASAAIEELRQVPAGEPFFLAVGFHLPHVPCHAPPRWFELYPESLTLLPPVSDDDRADVPAAAWFLNWRLPEPRLEWLERSGQWRPLVRAYLASTSFVDAQVGRLLEALDSGPHAGRTIVVLWSDHGYHLGEKALSGKNTLWESSTRVPLIFAGPGVAAGGLCRRPAELLDVFPTLSELCGLGAPAGLEGLSLVPQIQDATAGRDRPALTSHGPHNHSVRGESWRLIRYADGSEELYDHSRDPLERINLAGDPAAAEARLELARWLPQAPAAPLPGSRSRLVEWREGRPFWEGEEIDPAAPVPD